MYKAIRYFRLQNKAYNAGDDVSHLDKVTIHRLIKNKCIRETKEDKRIYELNAKYSYKPSSKRGEYLIMKGDQLIEIIKGKKNAINKVKELNNE